jgi:hypothetical protein
MKTFHNFFQLLPNRIGARASARFTACQSVTLEMFQPILFCALQRRERCAPLWLCASRGSLAAFVFSLLFIAAALSVHAGVPTATPLGALSQQLRAPARVAADAAGNLYVTESAAGRVAVFDAFGQLREMHDGFAGPLAIAIASDGRIYLSEEASGSVSVFDAQWQRLYQLGIGTNEFQLPGHLAVDPLAPGTVCVSDGAANVVRVYRGATQVGQFGGVGTGEGQFVFPAGVAVGANGEVFVVDQNNDRMEVFTNGVFERQFALGSGGMFGGPSGRSQALFLDNSGRAFVADTMQGCVKVFDAGTGLSLGTVGDFGVAPGQLAMPLGIVMDRYNRLCVASANNSRVEMFGVDAFLHLSVKAPNGIIAAGNDLVFNVTSGGAGQTFQWWKNGAPLDGATNAALTISRANIGDSGNYSVVITGASGAVTSSVTPISVLVSPNILSGPLAQKVIRGATASLGVVATGSALNFQWQCNGMNLPGATNAGLFLTDAQSAQSGQYAVRVSNAVGTAVSLPASVTVVDPPLAMDLVSSAAQPDRTFQLTLNVDPNFNYDLQATTDFVRWETVTNFTADGLYDYTDADATNCETRFYRLRWMQ